MAKIPEKVIPPINTQPTSQITWRHMSDMAEHDALGDCLQTLLGKLQALDEPVLPSLDDYIKKHLDGFLELESDAFKLTQTIAKIAKIQEWITDLGEGHFSGSIVEGAIMARCFQVIRTLIILV